jgi:hypothetical protein
MSHFLRLLSEADKAAALAEVSRRLQSGESDERAFQVPPEAFDSVPGKPFAYWVGESILGLFSSTLSLEASGGSVKQGLATTDDFRFIRIFWEVVAKGKRWSTFAKGGMYAPFYLDAPLLVQWENDGGQIKAEVCKRYPYLKGKWEWVAKNSEWYGHSGFTFTSYTILGFGARYLPKETIFSVAGMGVFGIDESVMALLNSRAIQGLLHLISDGRKWEAGVVQRIPIPAIATDSGIRLKILGRRAWSIKRTLDSTDETSHAFLLPKALRERLSNHDEIEMERELTRIQSEIDLIAFDLYGLSEADRAAVTKPMTSDTGGGAEQDSIDEEGLETDAPVDERSALLSWAVGVAYGRFDWRLATGERDAPTEPGPFDPLPVISPGMLPDGSNPFHAHAGILVEDQGHTHDLARLIEEVLARVEVPVPEDVRRWLQRDFFAFHLQRYSKSRRKAPLYWPLSTTSGSYTLWVYYPSLSSQTLYTAINDFVEPKLQQVGTDVTALRNKGSARTRDDERQFEALQAFELELIELRDTLLKLAPTYKPNHDDGVQISAALLWPLFRHKPWQKVLKETWTKLEKGDYGWAHLAMNYWPERVREKCKTDKSLAIAHGLEHLYVEPEAQPKKTRGRKKTGGDE